MYVSILTVSSVGCCALSYASVGTRLFELLYLCVLSERNVVILLPSSCLPGDTLPLQGPDTIHLAEVVVESPQNLHTLPSRLIAQQGGKDDDEEICIDSPTSSADFVLDPSHQSTTSTARRMESCNAGQLLLPRLGAPPSAKQKQSSAAALHPSQVGEHKHSLARIAEEPEDKNITSRNKPIVSDDCQGGRRRTRVAEFILQDERRRR